MCACTCEGECACERERDPEYVCAQEPEPEPRVPLPASAAAAVLSLLTKEREQRALLESRYEGRPDDAPSESETGIAPGSRIHVAGRVPGVAAFMLLDRLGSGSFGSVFKAVPLAECGRDAGRGCVSSRAAASAQPCACKVPGSPPAMEAQHALPVCALKCVPLRARAPSSAHGARAPEPTQAALHAQARMEVHTLTYLRAHARADVVGFSHVLTHSQDFEACGHLVLAFPFMPLTLLDIASRTRYTGLAGESMGDPVLRSRVPSAGGGMRLLRDICAQLLCGLHYTHAHGLLHGDIKLENVMLGPADEEGGAPPRGPPLRVRIIDFGSAAREGSLTHTYIQSRYYRAPEALLGVVPVTSAIDVWSGACVCIEMFCGLPLFPGSCEADLMQRIVALCGHPPEWMLDGGSAVDRFFTRPHPRGTAWAPDAPPHHGVVHAAVSVAVQHHNVIPGPAVPVPSPVQAVEFADGTPVVRFRRAHSDGSAVPAASSASMLPPTASAGTYGWRPASAVSGSAVADGATLRDDAVLSGSASGHAFRAAAPPRLSTAFRDVIEPLRTVRARMAPPSTRLSSRGSSFAMRSMEDMARRHGEPLPPGKHFYPVCSLRELVLGFDERVGLMPFLQLQPPEPPPEGVLADIESPTCLFFAHPAFAARAAALTDAERTERVLFLDLLRRMLAWDPRQRLTAAQALVHPFFTFDPASRHPLTRTHQLRESAPSIAVAMPTGTDMYTMATSADALAAWAQTRGWSTAAVINLAQADAAIVQRKEEVVAYALRKARWVTHASPHPTHVPHVSSLREGYLAEPASPHVISSKPMLAAPAMHTPRSLVLPMTASMAGASAWYPGAEATAMQRALPPEQHHGARAVLAATVPTAPVGSTWQNPSPASSLASVVGGSSASPRASGWSSYAPAYEQHHERSAPQYAQVRLTGSTGREPPHSNGAAAVHLSSVLHGRGDMAGDVASMPSHGDLYGKLGPVEERGVAGGPPTRAAWHQQYDVTAHVASWKAASSFGGHSGSPWDGSARPEVAVHMADIGRAKSFSGWARGWPVSHSGSLLPAVHESPHASALPSVRITAGYSMSGVTYEDASLQQRGLPMESPPSAGAKRGRVPSGSVSTKARGGSFNGDAGQAGAFVVSDVAAQSAGTLHSPPSARPANQPDVLRSWSSQPVGVPTSTVNGLHMQAVAEDARAVPSNAGDDSARSRHSTQELGWNAARQRSSSDQVPRGPTTAADVNVDRLGTARRGSDALRNAVPAVRRETHVDSPVRTLHRPPVFSFGSTGSVSALSELSDARSSGANDDMMSDPSSAAAMASSPSGHSHPQRTMSEGRSDLPWASYEAEDARPQTFGWGIADALSRTFSGAPRGVINASPISDASLASGRAHKRVAASGVRSDDTAGRDNGLNSAATSAYASTRSIVSVRTRASSREVESKPASPLPLARSSVV